MNFYRACALICLGGSILCALDSHPWCALCFFLGVVYFAD